MHELTHSILGRTLALALAIGIATFGCQPRPNLGPADGAPEYQLAGMVAVPGGIVNAAGGNLMIERLDLSIDTVLGIQEIRAVYNAHSGDWLWSFQVTYDGSEFLDPTGARHNLDAIADGAAIPGSVYVRADTDTIETKGGLAFHFDASGALSHVAWKTADYPRLQYTRTPGTLEIEQCPSAQSCLPFYAITLNPAGDPLSMTDARTGRVADFQYDGLGRLIVARDALAVDENWPGFQYEYSLGGTLLTAITNSEGERIEYAYQGNRRIRDVIQIGEGNPSHRFAYSGKDAAGFYKTLHTNPLGALTRYIVDGQRRLHRVELAETGELLTITWAGQRPASMRLPNGSATSFVYVADFLSTLTQPSGNVVTFLHAPGGLNRDSPLVRPIARIEDSLGPIEERTYDALGRLETIVNGEGETTVFTYNPGWAVASITDSIGVTRTFPVYGVHGHWLELDGPVSDKRAFDPVGNAIVASVVHERGGILTRGYDANRSLSSLEMAATGELAEVTSSNAISISRRSDGQPTYVARPAAANHSFEYDTLGRVVAQLEWVDGQWQTTTFEYDAAGNLTARERPNGMREEYELDGYGRITRHRALRDGMLEGEAIFTYADGQLASVTDSVRDASEVYVYDAAGRVTSILFAFAETIEFEYDLRSRKTAEVYSVPVQGVIANVGYDYDLADRQIRVTDRLAQELLIERVFENGRLLTTRYGNGLVRDRDYDLSAGRLIALTTTDASSDVVEATHLEYTSEIDPARQQIRTLTDTALASTEEQFWLGLGGSFSNPDLQVGKRVFRWNRGGVSSQTYAYDELSNQMSDSTGNAFAYNAERNRLLSVTLAQQGLSLNYTYDEAGFATSRAGVPLTWTATGRMASVGLDTLNWDMRGRLISVFFGGEERKFLLFGGRIESDPGSGTIGALDLGEVLIQIGSNERRYRHLDFRGNVRFVSDETGQIVNHYRYSPFGVDAVFGSGGNGVTFVGRPEIGELMILGLRIYDPAIGRFLSPDPIFQSINQYVYTLGNPVWFSDPDGTDGIDTGVAVGAGAILVANVVEAVATGGALSGVGAVAIGISLGLGGLLFAIAIAVALSRSSLSAAVTTGLSPSPGPVPASPPNGGCAPTALAETPNLAPLLWFLLPIQMLLAWLLLGRRIFRVTRHR